MTIGIGYCIPNRKPGINWSSYWTPQSAVVENANPSDVVLTYTNKLNPADAIAENFAIAGKTISNADLDSTNKILTLTVTVVFAYGDSIMIVANEENIAVTNNINPDIGYDPNYALESLSTPTIYVDSAASGANNGTSWANAYTSLATAYTNSSNGSVIEVSGGESGKTYTVNLDITKIITLQGSRTSGHSGQVVINGYIYGHNTSGVIKIVNIKHIRNTDAYAMYSYANSSLSFYDCILGEYITTNKNNELYGNASFTNCRFLLSIRSSAKNRTLFYPRAAITLTFVNCLLQHSGYLFGAPSGMNLSMRNSTIIDSFGRSSWYSVPDNNTTLLINTAFIGCHPLTTTASATPPVVKNCFWHKTPSITASAQDKLYFDSSNVATATDCIDHELPYFTDAKTSLGGYLSIRYDDRVNLATAVSVAAVLNPEVKITQYVDIHGGAAGTRPTAQQIDNMRTLIAGGNEIGNHSASHSDSSDLGIINISATGTSPTLDLSVTQSGDSTTWSGTLTITINSVAQAFDMAVYNTIGTLLAAINGASVGNGVVTATKNNPAHSDGLPSCCLNAISGQSISSLYEMNLNDAAFLQYEITESILDLEAYINTGEDRNGNNAVTGTTVTPPATTYVCKTFAAAYSRSRASLATLMQSNANIIGACLGNNGIYLIYQALTQSIYTQATLQMTDDNMEEDLFAVCAASAVGELIYQTLFHGYTPKFNGTVAGFKTLCQNFGVGDKTFAEIIDYVRNDAGWTITEPNIAFTGDYEDYLYQGDFALEISSPLKRGGTKDIS